VSQLEFDRDMRYPLMIASAKRQIQALQEFGARSPEAARRAAERLFGTENWVKAMRGEYKALQDPSLRAAKAKDESLLRKSFVATPDHIDPWAAMEGATRKEGDQIRAAWVVGYGYGTLFDTAGTIVELANESTLSEAERLAAYRPSAIPRLMLRVAADEPIYKDLEIARLTSYWQEALVKRVLGDKTPLDAATAVIDGTRMNELQERKRMLDGGLAGIAASTDPLIMLARDVYPLRRRLAKLHEVEVETPTLRAGDELERMRYELFGTDAYPDATGSLRLSYGIVRGYDADGILTPWQTNFWGLLGRSAAFGAQPPFDLPPRWSERQRNLDLSTPLNFVSTLDIIGGNSGSPVVNRNGELVGLVFDGNLEGLGGRFVYTDDKARAIAVDSRAIVEALTKIYDAREIVREITRR
ncbi:MAG: S46 family peptidase, partial [Betaproteobacteria bacterium]